MQSTAPPLRTVALSRAYGSRRAVDGLDLEVHPGELFGFLGPNGAGKTTTIRMALGLVRPTSGRVELFGCDVRSHAPAVLPRVGALVEAPALYGHLSGRDNLRAVRGVLGRAPDRRLDEVIDLVGLRGREGDRVRAYSLGMKQRLGLAMALLDDPELLVLDEPANGLDPAGVVEMRDLLRRLAAAGKTVFISSHVLGEVQQVCTRVAIIDRGRLVKVAPVAELVGPNGEFVVAIDHAPDVLEIVRRQPWGAAARLEDGRLVTPAPGARGRDLVEFLVRAGHIPDGVAPRSRDLEDIFLDLTRQGSES